MYSTDTQHTIAEDPMRDEKTPTIGQTIDALIAGSGWSLVEGTDQALLDQEYDIDNLPCEVVITFPLPQGQKSPTCTLRLYTPERTPLMLPTPEVDEHGKVIMRQHGYIADYDSGPYGCGPLPEVMIDKGAFRLSVDRVFDPNPYGNPLVSFLRKRALDRKKT